MPSSTKRGRPAKRAQKPKAPVPTPPKIPPDGWQEWTYDDYIAAVVGEKIPACELVKLACARHLRDLKTGAMRGLRFDPDAADHAIKFFRYLRHSKGEWAGSEFVLSPWQKFIQAMVYGWKREDGTRRFRTIYEEIARKNGKTTQIAGNGLYLLVGDNEPGAEIYSAATKRDQARISHSEAMRMVKKSPELLKRIRIVKDNLHIEDTACKFEPLGADADTMDGLNPHGALVDEVHAHKSRAVVDVLETATGSRRQPITWYITTAGYDRNSVCYELHTYAEQVLKGLVEDDTFFAFIATIDEGDDWKDPAVWAKANPNLGISVKLDDLERKANKAKQMPSAQNAFQRLHLNVWTQQVDRWIDLGVWDENASGRPLIDEIRLAGRQCYGGLDLASVSDLNALVWVFPDESDPESIDVLCRFWCPEAQLHSDDNKYAAQYRAWKEQGFLQTTPGNAVDYGFIVRQVLEDAARFNVVDMNLDQLFQGVHVGQELTEAGLTVLPFNMRITGFAMPMKEFERRLLLRKINHGGNPVLRWMADGCAVWQNPNGDFRPDKANSQTKIDGLVALVMALDRAMRHEERQATQIMMI